MIVIGAKGFAKELLEDLISSKYGYNEENLFFFDDISEDIPERLFGKYRILRSISEVKEVFDQISNEFSIGVGTPKYRETLSDKFESIGGAPKTIISELSSLGTFENNIDEGTTIMAGARLTNSIKIGKGTLINLNCTIGHDCNIGDFVEITPNVCISGRCKIGSLSSLGTGVIVIPDVTIGKNCIIGAGTVVTKDVPDNSVVVGVPGKVIKTIED